MLFERFGKLSTTLLASILTAALVVFIAVRVAGASEPESKDTTPPGAPTYASSGERYAAEKAAAQEPLDAEALAFPDNFGSGGRDVHELPVRSIGQLPIGSWGATLSDAVNGSPGVAIGTVTEQYVSGRQDIFIESRLEVSRWLAGGQGETFLNIRQAGYPYWNDGDPFLAQEENDPVLKYGHRYILFISQCPPTVPKSDGRGPVSCISISGRQFEIMPDNTVHTGFEFEEWTRAADGSSVVDFQQAIEAVAG